MAGGIKGASPSKSKSNKKVSKVEKPKDGERVSNVIDQINNNKDKLGTGAVGDFSGIEKWSIDEIITRVSKDAMERKLKPVVGKVTEGIEYRWVQDGQTIRVRIHGPDLSAPPGSNASNGWIVRVQKGRRYLDPDTGKFLSPGISNPKSPHYNEDLANRTHIPINYK